MKKKSREKYLGAPTPPEDQAICLFAGLLANPDMTLRLSLSILEDHVLVDVEFFDHQTALSQAIDSDGKGAKTQQVDSIRGQRCGDDHC